MNSVDGTSGYTEIANVLREVADALAGLNTEGLAPLIVGVTLQPSSDDEDVKVATVNAIAEALETASKPIKMSSGTWHYHTERTWRTAISTRVAAFCSVTPPEERKAREEADRLRAEVESLRSQLAERDDGPGIPVDMEAIHAAANVVS